MFINTEPRNPTRQSLPPVSAFFPALSSPSSTLFFSKACSHTDTTTASQAFSYQSLSHSFCRDGGGAPSSLSNCSSFPLSLCLSISIPALLRPMQPSCLHAIAKCKFLNSFLLIFIHQWWGWGSPFASFLNYHFRLSSTLCAISNLPNTR